MSPALPVLVVICSTAVVTGVRGWLLSRHLHARAHWPEVPGRVLTVEAVPVSTLWGVSQVTWCQPRVWYEYTAQGARYRGHIDRLGVDGGHSTAETEQTAARFPVGRMLTIRHDPERPERSFAEEEEAPEPVNLYAACGALLFVAYVAGMVTIGQG